MPTFDCGRWKISFDDQTGAGNYLLDTSSSALWASGLVKCMMLMLTEDSQFLLVEYQTFSERNFIDFLAEYSPCTGTEECEIALRTVS